MKTTYNCTWTISKEELPKRIINVELYDKCKYTKNAKVIKKVQYTGVTAWDIIDGGEEAEEIESMTDESGVDPHHEYLVLHYIDGVTSTFRNSLCDMMIEF